MIRLPRIPALASLCMQVALVGVAAAAPPVSLDKTQAVAGPRSDAGTGLCGSITHFAAALPLSTKAEAVAIVDKPTTDPMVLSRATRLFGNINFRNGQANAGGDFTGTSAPDAIFPFSSDPMAMPMGTDANFIMRLRGYFNVPAALTGKTISFGINCDDFCTLQIGTTAVFPLVDERISSRVIKQVSFKDPGLYPIELVYFQNGSSALLEWSRTDVTVNECPNDICQVPLTDPLVYQGNFKLVQAAELYSSVAGADSACQECTSAGTSCAAGNYCGDGLCQACNTADHCGASCQACPANAHQCRSGSCVECTADAQCATGQQCELTSGHCQSPMTTPPAYTGGCALGGSTAAAPGWWVAGSLLALALGGLRRRRRHLS